MLTKRSDYPKMIRYRIKGKEVYLGRNCWKLWEHTPKSGITYLFGKFSKGRGDTIIVTIAARRPDTYVWQLQY